MSEEKIDAKIVTPDQVKENIDVLNAVATAMLRTLKETTIIEKKESQSSYEFGKASNRHKIYYDDGEDLKKKIKEALEGEKYLDQLQAEMGKVGQTE